MRGLSTQDLSEPVALNNSHDTSQFYCGDETLDEWLKKRALKNQKSGASRSFVSCRDNQVIGYYALATGSVERLNAPKAIARNMPAPISVIILARLAIDVQYQGQRLGVALLKNAMLRTLSITPHVGIRALLVHSISENAKNFYLNYGFQPTSISSTTLMLSIQNLKNTFNA